MLKWHCFFFGLFAGRFTGHKVVLAHGNLLIIIPHMDFQLAGMSLLRASTSATLVPLYLCQDLGQAVNGMHKRDNAIFVRPEYGAFPEGLAWDWVDLVRSLNFWGQIQGGERLICCYFLSEHRCSWAIREPKGRC